MDPVVVLAADEAFAMPLAVTVRSALENLAEGRKLQIYVLDGGIQESTKQRVERSWPAGRFVLNWLSVDEQLFAKLPVWGHVSQVAYYRLLLPKLLPEHLSRVIFLDCDLLVCGDLSELWQCDQRGFLCLAVQDCAAPYIDAMLAIENAENCCPHLGSTMPIENYQELGLNPLMPYFNSGVMVVDVDGWRRESLSQQLLDCLEENRSYIRWWDQYALNVVLADRWGMLDPRWNQGANVYNFSRWDRSYYDRETYLQVLEHPFIIHFTTKFKPWKITCIHPRRKQFFKVLDRTEWSGWRPPKFDSAHSMLEFLKTQQRRLRYASRRFLSSWSR
ncbi:General stress protein A [Aeoliella mucimassa]|uniref:General stress protein A n=2 Tax=Aeoliella mucimassa TaxID=2527972 RepID=A0A518ALG2_9BACT|nr:General stress protein A [Aeoliella mucimassa]